MEKHLNTTAKGQSLSTTGSKSVLEQLNAEFPKSEVKSRAGGFGKNLDYIDIPSTISRFNEILGTSWDWVYTNVSISPHSEGKFLTTVQGYISVYLEDGTTVTRAGVGADIDKDPDKALKTADAEAFKKAGHKFGVGLYLWDESKREEIGAYRDAAKASVPELQKIVIDKSGRSQEALKEEFGTLLKSKEGLLSVLDTLGA